MHKYEAALLEILKAKKEIALEEAIRQLGIGKDETLWAIENLSKDSLISVKKQQEHDVKVTSEGKKYAGSMLPEEQLLTELHKRGLKPAELSKEEQIGMQWCIKKGFAAIEKGVLTITEKGKKQAMPTVEGSVLTALSQDPASYEDFLKSDRNALEALEKRRLIEVKARTRILSVSVTEKGLKAEISSAGGTIDAVTREVITSRLWEKDGFKPYNVTLNVEKEPMAMRHPLRQLMRKMRGIYTSMGFTEISGPVVEPSFWVFDSLFVPQDHPARDAQDTFYLSNPTTLEVGDEDYVDVIKRAHKKSWKEPWKLGVAENALLRTHTTSISARYISTFVKAMLKEGGSYNGAPIKRFAIGRVFRNENIDYKHLADFYQHDGIIIGKDLTLANLFSTLIELYDKLDIKLRFKPAYFPFVEPGAEMFAKPKGSDKWIEMGGCGIIRSEVTGVSRKKLSVLAWGPGLERILLADGSVGSLTELYNPSVGWLRSAKML